MGTRPAWRGNCRGQHHTRCIERPERVRRDVKFTGGWRNIAVKASEKLPALCDEFALLLGATRLERKMTSEDQARAVLSGELERAKGWGRKYRKFWSFYSHGLAWTIPSLSAASGILSRFDNVGPISLPVVATILSATVVVISSFQISSRRKWASYRRTQTEVRLLKLDLDMGEAPSQIRERLGKIYRAHDDDVIGHNPGDSG
jgi:hypothetical protein